MNDLIKALFGTDNLILIVTGYTWGLIGTILSLIWSVSKRNKNSPRSSHNFDWNFYKKDNRTRIIINLLSLAILLRFCNEFLGTSLTAYSSIIIGLSIDRGVAILKKINTK